MIQRMVSTSERRLADKAPNSGKLLDWAQYQRRLVEAARLIHISLRCQPQKQNPSYNGQLASPSAMLPVFFRSDMGWALLAQFLAVPSSKPEKEAKSWRFSKYQLQAPPMRALPHAPARSPVGPASTRLSLHAARNPCAAIDTFNGVLASHFSTRSHAGSVPAWFFASQISSSPHTRA
jgi:hypothetical protein